MALLIAERNRINRGMSRFTMGERREAEHQELPLSPQRRKTGVQRRESPTNGPSSKKAVGGIEGLTVVVASPRTTRLGRT